jgi:hypothetical protein
MTARLDSWIGYVLALVIGLLLGWILFHNDVRTSQSVTYIKGDSFPYVVFQGVPKPYAVRHNDTHWIETIRDSIRTIEVVRDYFAEVDYLDTVKNDTSALIVIAETINQNRITDRVVTFQNNRPIAIIHQRNKAILTAFGGTLNGVEVGLGYRYHKNALIATYSNQGVGMRFIREW